MSSNFKIVTGYTGTPHVTAQQDRFINQSLLGNGNYILPTGNRLSPTINSATQININDGAVSIQGCVGIIDPGYGENLTIDSGALGYNRIDYICAKYSVTGQGIESMELVVKKGTPSTGTPNAPTYTTGSIESGANEVEAPLFQVNIEGLSISSVARIAAYASSNADILTAVNGVNSLMSGKTSFFTFASDDDLITAMGTMSTGDVFTFRGKDSFSQDVLNTDSQQNAFGLGLKTASTTAALLIVCGGKLYYTAYKTDGTGTVYIPLVLTQNV